LKIIKRKIAKGVKKEIKRMLSWMRNQKISSRQINDVVMEIFQTQVEDEKGKPKNIKTIFIGGLGRSGSDADGFGMRLAHLGFDARVLGEPTMPPVKKDDLVIVISGSGKSLIKSLETAKENGAKIIVITSREDSPAAELADIKFIIPGREEDEFSSLSYEERSMKGVPALPLGTAFEDLTMVVMDAIISVIAIIQKKKEEDLKTRHANIQKET